MGNHCIDMLGPWVKHHTRLERTIPEIKINGELIMTMPNKHGLWFISCNENENIFEPVSIFYIDHCLYVEDLNIGVTPLDLYHNGLTDIKWLRQAGKKHKGEGYRQLKSFHPHL